MIGTMVLLKKIPTPIVKMIVQGEADESCTLDDNLVAYISGLNIEQFEGLCSYIREHYSRNLDALKRKTGEADESCTLDDNLVAYISGLNIEQFEGLCSYIREHYSRNLDALKRKTGYTELTAFERRCVAEYERRVHVEKAKEMENDFDIVEVYPGHGVALPVKRKQPTLTPVNSQLNEVAILSCDEDVNMDDGMTG
ncbi:hypothetical protein DICVIV_05686 [Dictyocaulus viviparus]|uniref:Uncharacterized protein n=1 Tax=Dictyocaulus viviparus TaxID=29172 RepID=A0A0D8XWP9_DICVI|nr:hypothetical protein DICVIV_05686 [Dictyocaulus viviparus]